MEKKYVSFSTNNYLSIATSPRLINAASRGLETYGVGNCESRLLSGSSSNVGTSRQKQSNFKP
jgi:7-keto-8-aminopelargonate synthetase-like enzyme